MTDADAHASDRDDLINSIAYYERRIATLSEILSSLHATAGAVVTAKGCSACLGSRRVGLLNVPCMKCNATGVIVKAESAEMTRAKIEAVADWLPADTKHQPRNTLTETLRLCASREFPHD